MSGSVVAIYVTSSGAEPMHGLDAAELEADRGIRGDRYHALRGTFSKKGVVPPDQQITLVESEEIDEFNRKTGSSLDYGAVRRNVVTRDVRLNDLVGTRFSIGDAVLEGIELCEPCAHLAALVTEKVLPNLVHRAGLRARIITGGTVKPADPITI